MGKRGRKPSIQLSKEELEAALDEEGSVYALAIRLGKPHITVRKTLDRMGIDRPKRNTVVERPPNSVEPCGEVEGHEAKAYSKEELVAQLDRLGSMKALGQFLGIHYSEVGPLLDSHGIPRPKRGGYKGRKKDPQHNVSDDKDNDIQPIEAIDVHESPVNAQGKTQEVEHVKVPDEPETPQIEAEKKPDECIPDSNIPTVCEPLVPAEEMSYPERWTNAVDGPQAPPGDALANAVNILAERLSDLVDTMARQERNVTIANPESPSEELLKALTSGDEIKAVEMPDVSTTEGESADIRGYELSEEAKDMAIPSYDDLAHLHYGLMMSIHEMGRQYRVLGSTVQRWMLYRGLPLWTETEKEELRKLKERVNKRNVSPETLDKAHADYVEFWDLERERYGYAPQECCRERDKAVA